MDKELLLFILMVGSFMISCFALKLPSGMGMVIAAVVGALAGIFGAEVAGVDRYSKVLRKCLIPALLIIVVSMLFIIFANPIASILG